MKGEKRPTTDDAPIWRFVTASAFGGPGQEESAMPSLTKNDIVAMLGEADDDLIVQLIGTGATQAELAEAYAWLRSDEALVNEGRPLPCGQVGTLVEILQTAEETEELEMG